MIQWEQCKRDFAWEGSLRDIYIFEVKPEDWRSLYKILPMKYRAEYLVDQRPHSVPEVVDEAFTARTTRSPLLLLRAGDVPVCCHFFDWTEVEFDIDPRDIKAQADLNAVLEFMKTAGDCLSKRVVLTPENMRDVPIISYDPVHSSFQYHLFIPTTMSIHVQTGPFKADAL